MKKLLPILIILAIITLSSCTKVYTCNCVITVSGTRVASQSTSISSSSRSTAENQCSAIGSSATNGSYSETCSLQ